MNNSSLAHDVLTGRAPELSPQSATLWALAWSDEPESLAEPVPYTGGDDVAPQSGETRRRLPVLLFSIAASAAAIAIGGLALTLGGTDTQPEPAVTTESVQIAVTPGQEPAGDGTRAGGNAPRPSLPVAVGSPAAQTVPRVANAPQRVINASAPSAAAGPASAPQAAVPQNVGAPAAPAPAPAAPAPAAPAPAAPGPAPVTIMVAPPPSAAPPVSAPPIVSIPEVTPMPMPNPVFPPTFHVPSVPVAPNPVVPPILQSTPAPLAPKPGIVVPPVLHEPVAPAASNPAITLPTDVTLTPLVPNLP